MKKGEKVGSRSVRVWFPPPVLDAVRAGAVGSGMAVSEYVRTIVVGELDRRGKLAGVAGSGNGGRP